MASDPSSPSSAPSSPAPPAEPPPQPHAIAPEKDTPLAAAPTGAEASTRRWWRWLGVAGLCLAIWGGLALVWPLWEKHRAYEIVAEHFHWDETEKTAWVRDESMGTSPGALRELDRRTARALRLVGTRTLFISDCPGITSVVALGDIATLEDVTFRSCSGLTSISGLPTGTRKLNLCGCMELTGIADLPAGVDYINVSYCRRMTSLEGLPAGVRCLILRDCTVLTKIGKLPPGLNSVQMQNTPKLPEAVKAEIRALVKKNGGEVRG